MTEVEFVHEIAQPLSDSADGYDGLIELIGDARFVLLGEPTHGTHEFYSERAAITKRLIAEKGFSILAIEADWPDSSRVHRYVCGDTTDANSNEALSGFRRFPTWMWRNTVIVEFIEWLRGFNSSIDSKRGPVGFYGMDLYSLHASIEAVLRYLEKVDPRFGKERAATIFVFRSFQPQAPGIRLRHDGWRSRTMRRSSRRAARRTAE